MTETKVSKDDARKLALLESVLDIEFYTMDELAIRYPETFPVNARRFSSVDRMKATVTDSGSHYFSPGANRFFSSRVSQTLYGNRFTVESTGSEDWGIARAYRVIWVAQHENGSLSVERSVYYGSRAIAHRVARDLAREF